MYTDCCRTWKKGLAYNKGKPEPNQLSVRNMRNEGIRKGRKNEERRKDVWENVHRIRMNHREWPGRDLEPCRTLWKAHQEESDHRSGRGTYKKSRKESKRVERNQKE